MTVAFNVYVFYTGCMNMPVPLTPAGVSPARRGHKKETTCGFLLLVNLPLSLRGHGENRRDETAPKRGTAEDFFSATDELPSESVLLSNLFAGSDTVLLHMRVNQRKARHDSAAQILGTLYRTAPTNLDVWYNLSS